MSLVLVGKVGLRRNRDGFSSFSTPSRRFVTCQREKKNVGNQMRKQIGGKGCHWSTVRSADWWNQPLRRLRLRLRSCNNPPPLRLPTPKTLDGECRCPLRRIAFSGRIPKENAHRSAPNVHRIGWDAQVTRLLSPSDPLEIHPETGLRPLGRLPYKRLTPSVPTWRCVLSCATHPVTTV